MDKMIKRLVYLAAAVTFFTLFFIIGYVLFKGLPHISPDLFALEYNSENLSMLPAIITTVYITLISLVISVPVGIFTGIYLVEYANVQSRIVRIIRLTTETLSGIPSIVYGLFGSLFFVTYLKLGYSIFSGALTLSIMILPLIIRTTEESLSTVANELREGSYALGANKIRTVFKVILPAAFPGIFAGIILSIGRIVGESAALIYTAGTFPQIPNSLLSSGRTLAIHMYTLSSEGLHTDKAYATAVVLLLIVLIMNFTSSHFARKIIKEDSDEI